MKLLIVHNRYQSNNIGGEDIVYQNELKYLKKELGDENVFSYEVSNDDINKIKLFFNIWFSKEHYKNVKKIVNDNKINIVHVHNFYPLLTPSIFKAAADAGAKVVHTLHNYRLWCISGIFYRDGYGRCELCTKNKLSLKGILNRCYRKSFLQSVLAQSSFWFYRFSKMFDYIDCFFVLTEFQKKKVQFLGIDEKKIILKPNSLNMSFDVKNEKDGYIYVGRLEEAKGIIELLKVWQNLEKKYKLTIIGSGNIEEQLKNKYSSNNVVFKGKCSREETLKAISKSKYLIQPSIWYETFGLTMIEAMGFGVPVIGLNIGTRGDFIEDGVNGFLGKKSDLQDMITKSFNYAKYDLLSKNALLKSKEFENSYVIKKQIKIYKSLLEK